MRIWRGTATLDGLIDDLTLCGDKAEAQVLLVGGQPIDLDDFPQLEGIFKTGVGTDNLPFDEAKSRRVKIVLPSEETRDVVFDETASFACQLILRCLYRDVGVPDKWQKASRDSLASRTVLVIGTGNIGRRVRDKMTVFCTVTTFDAIENQPDELKPLVEQADCISLHVPLNAQTRDFFDAEKLGWMKDGAALVNTARGPVVSEDALYAELSSGRLFAAFDVFWQEPYEGKLKALHPDPFYMTPHVASTCREFLEGTARDFRQFLAELDY